MQRAARCLVDRGIADVPLTVRTLGVAADHGWTPGYAGAALARPEAWSNPEATVQTWTGFIRSMPTAAHGTLPSWTHAATFGAARVPYVLGASAARAVVSQILSTVVFVTVMTPTVVAGCVAAAADAVRASGVTLDDPLPLVVQSLRDTLREQLPPEQVAPYLLGAFSDCSETVQSTVRRSLLE